MDFVWKTYGIGEVCSKGEKPVHSALVLVKDDRILARFVTIKCYQSILHCKQLYALKAKERSCMERCCRYDEADNERNTVRCCVNLRLLVDRRFSNIEDARSKQHGNVKPPTLLP